MLNPLPSLAAMPSKQWPGADTLASEVLPLEVLSWDDTWDQPWDSDAHFVCYRLNVEGEAMPRCNKRVLPALRAAGHDLLSHVLVLDYDNPHKATWTAESLGDFFSRLQELTEDWPLGYQWAVVYTTKHGARLVYVLDDPVPVDAAEGMHRWLVEQWTQRGLVMDPACSDWTRLFRLPRVLRSDEKTWEQGYFALYKQSEARLPVAELGSVVSPYRQRKAQLKEYDLPQPDPSIADDLLVVLSEETGKPKQSDWLTKAKRRLKGRASYPALFQHKPLAYEGSRHNTILKYVGEATSLLYNMDVEGVRLTTPQHLYALFLDPVQQLEPDQDTPDWTETLWRHVLYCWASEEAAQEVRDQEAKEQRQDALARLERIIQGMREWCDHPTLLGADAEAKAWALQHMIAVGPRGYYVMRQDGWYDSLMTTKESLIPRIRSLGLEGVIQTQVPTETGFRWVRAQDLINEYGTAVSSISGKPQIRGSYIHDIDKQSSVLNLRLYGRRTDIQPQYDPRVDEWLKRLFGRNYDEAINWLAWSLAFEEGPTCALSLQGAAGAGKKMLAYGLAECVDTRTLAQAEDLTGQYQPGLLRSPFLLVDEGWPGRRGGKHPADMFRELVGGSTRQVDTKFRNPVQTTNPVRVIFTANDLNVVRMLTQDRDLSPEDREALGIRLLHFDITHQATFWLRAQGGERFTRGWVAGDGGQESDHVVAKHFLWLHQNKRQPRQKRLLVEGNSNSKLMRDMRTQSGSAPIVIECIIRMLEVNKRWRGLVVEDDRLYVLASDILTFWRQELKHDSRYKLTTANIGQVLRGLVNCRSKQTMLDSRKELGRKRWHEVDCSVLLDRARCDGWDSNKLEELVKRQRERGILYKRDETTRLAYAEAGFLEDEAANLRAESDQRRAAEGVGSDPVAFPADHGEIMQEEVVAAEGQAAAPAQEDT